MTQRSTSRSVSARDAVELLRGPLSNAQVMEKFRISPEGFADLLKQLFQKKLINEEDLERRGIRFKVVKQAPSVQQASIFPPPPLELDEEFLDTVTLTELLTFKTPEPAKMATESAEITPPEDTTEKRQDEKKGKFSLTGLFKKAR